MSSILFCDIDLIDAQGNHTSHAYVGVKDDVIVYVGTEDPQTADAAGLSGAETSSDAHEGLGAHAVSSMYSVSGAHTVSSVPTTYDETYDGRGKILMPGLYNAHSHVPMTLLRGLGENMPLDRWAQRSNFPIRSAYDRQRFLPCNTCWYC